MKKYQHLLVALSLRNNEDDYLLTKAKLFMQEKTLITLVHVVEPLSNHSMLTPSKIAYLEAQLFTTASEKMWQIAEQLTLARENCRILMGKPKRMITHLAHELNCDGILIGNPERNELELLLLGSITTAVLQQAPCDVVSIKIPVN